MVPAVARAIRRHLRPPVLLASLLAVALAGLARVRARRLTVFAHRGFAAEAPENTVDAVSRAVARTDAIEVDVRRCASGELVCVHDETLERLTGVPARVDETAWETLRVLEVGPGATIPRLDDVLAVVPPDVLVNVELKARGLEADVLEAIADHDGDVLVSSFDPDTLAAVRTLDPDVPLAYVCRSPRGAVATATALGCDAIHPRWDLAFRSPLVGRAHRRGLAVNAWTIRSRLEARALALVGVDGVFTDRAGVR